MLRPVRFLECISEGIHTDLQYLRLRASKLRCVYAASSSGPAALDLRLTRHQTFERKRIIYLFFFLLKHPHFLFTWFIFLSTSVLDISRTIRRSVNARIHSLQTFLAI